MTLLRTQTPQFTEKSLAANAANADPHAWEKDPGVIKDDRKPFAEPTAEIVAGPRHLLSPEFRKPIPAESFGQDVMTVLRVKKH